jgi:hypothetical protein
LDFGWCESERFSLLFWSEISEFLTIRGKL